MKSHSYADLIPGAIRTVAGAYQFDLCEQCLTPVRRRRGTPYRRCDCSKILIHQYRVFKSKPASEENDFNPYVCETCAVCEGEGVLFSRSQEAWTVTDCSSCAGQGIHTKKQYPEDLEPIPIEVAEDGWTKCPHCGFRFNVRDKNVWNGPRHGRCGQKLIVPDNWLLYW
ncbi:MAG: hypothetical protein K1Y36_10210 [Blastocatellia bacterium]|nr:hypothetical protein [Blastocatellia bacterium]